MYHCNTVHNLRYYLCILRNVLSDEDNKGREGDGSSGGGGNTVMVAGTDTHSNQLKAAAEEAVAAAVAAAEMSAGMTTATMTTMTTTTMATAMAMAMVTAAATTTTLTAAATAAVTATVGATDNNQPKSSIVGAVCADDNGNDTAADNNTCHCLFAVFRGSDSIGLS